MLNVACSGPGVSRTCNLSVTSPILYQLDHCSRVSKSLNKRCEKYNPAWIIHGSFRHSSPRDSPRDHTFSENLQWFCGFCCGLTQQPQMVLTARIQRQGSIMWFFLLLCDLLYSIFTILSRMTLHLLLILYCVL